MGVEGQRHHVRPEAAPGEVEDQLADEDLGAPGDEGRLGGAHEDGLHARRRSASSSRASRARRSARTSSWPARPRLVSAEDEVDAAHEVLHVSDELPLEEDVPLVDLVEAPALLPQEPVVVPVGGREALLDVAEELVVQADLVRVPGPLGLEAPAEQAAEGAVDEAEKAAPRLALAPTRLR